MKSWHAIAIIIMALITWAIRGGYLALTEVGALAAVQLPVFFIVVVIVTTIRILDIALPKTVLVLATLGACSALAAAHLRVGVVTPVVVLASFDGDEYQARTRIMRERFNANLGALTHTKAVSISRLIKSDEGARKLLRERARVLGVLWPTERWIFLSLPNAPSASLEDVGARLYPPWFRELRLVTASPLVGVSLEPKDQTGLFYSLIFAALVPENIRIPRALKNLTGGPTDYEAALALREQFLIEAATLKSFWISHAHQAYPLFLLGNDALSRALAGDVLEPASLACAEWAYREALTRLRSGDNPELRAALYNNLGVVSLLLGIQGGLEKRIQEAQRLWERAFATRRERNLYGIPFYAFRVARFNQAITRSALLSSVASAVKEPSAKKGQAKKKRGV